MFHVNVFLGMVWVGDMGLAGCSRQDSGGAESLKQTATLQSCSTLHVNGFVGMLWTRDMGLALLEGIRQIDIVPRRSRHGPEIGLRSLSFSVMEVTKEEKRERKSAHGCTRHCSSREDVTSEGEDEWATVV